MSLNLDAAELDDTTLSYTTVLDALPIVAYIASPDGKLAYVSRGWTELTGIDSNELLESGYQIAVHADDVVDVAKHWADARAAGALYRDQFRLRCANGTYRWVLSQAQPYHAPASGKIIGWFGTITDIDDHQQAIAKIQEQAKFLEQLLEAGYQCIKVLELDGRLVSMNVDGMRVLCIDDFAQVKGSSWLDFWQAEDRESAMAAVESAQAGGIGRFFGRFDVKGEVRFWEVIVTPMNDAVGRPERLLAVSRDITEQRLAQHARRLERSRSEARMRVLVDAGTILSESLDYATTLRNIASLAVGSVATFCMIDLIEDQRLRRVAVVHAQGESAAQASALESHMPDRSHRTHPVVRAIVDRQSTIVADADARWPQGFGLATEEIAALHVSEVRSWMTVPIVYDRQVFGAVTFCLDASDIAAGKSLPYDPTDRIFGEEFGRRAGTAIHHALSYGREHRISVELQSISMPQELPLLEGLKISAEYRPGNAEATIGGDWYDVFELQDKRLVFTIGDVLGSGLHAALVMTKLRQAMRAAALVAPDPQTMLDIADQTLKMEDQNTYATALAAIYQPDTRRLTFASAGHPGPMVRHHDGRVDHLTSPGMMLGLRSGEDIDTASSQLSVGSALVFFTDGLTENTHDFEAGYRRLCDALGEIDVARASNPAADLVKSVLGDLECGDDLAVLIVGVEGPA